MAQMPSVGEFCWNELCTPNVKAAKDFYGAVFGWQFVDHNTEDTSYTMVKHKDKDMMAGIWAIPKDKQKEVPPHWMAYILVDDLEKAIEKATKHGAKVIKPATAAGDFGRFSILTDPTGAHIALWQPTQKK